jgi:indole-3-acetate monooxygenase
LRTEAVRPTVSAASSEIESGTTAIFENHPLARRFRDIHTVTQQQLQGQFTHFETVGAWMMGADTDLTFV